jgi:hypothetical protein
VDKGKPWNCAIGDWLLLPAFAVEGFAALDL